MLTQEQVKKQAKTRDRGGCDLLDARDYARLVEFFPIEDFPIFGMALKDDTKGWEQRPWTEMEVREQLNHDLEFAFEKALDQRGTSSGLMYEVIKMWMWVLEDPLQYYDNYPMYGLPLYKAVALKYGLENPIGNDVGDESKYDPES